MCGSVGDKVTVFIMTVTHVDFSQGPQDGLHRGSTQLIIISLELLGLLSLCKNVQGVVEDLGMKMIGFSVEKINNSHT